VGVILCCIESNSRCYVIVRHLEPLMAGTEPVCNDFDCPLYSLTSILRSIPSAAIIWPVSVVHQCTSTCSLQNKNASMTLEWQVASQKTLCFSHDWSNTFYCYNVYCKSNVL
jgi:hypothetical protein